MSSFLWGGRLLLLTSLGSYALFGQAPFERGTHLGAPRASSGPGIIAIGSPLTFGGDNTPDTFSATTTFSSTPVQADNGKVTIWQNQVPTGPNSEWDVFYIKTTSGGPLAGDINAEWKIQMNYTLTAAVFFDQVVSQWQVNGTPVSPLNNNLGGPSAICCATLSNPILAGPAFYNSGFSGPYRRARKPTGEKYLPSPTILSRRAASTRILRTNSSSLCISRFKRRFPQSRERSAQASLEHFRPLAPAPGLKSTEATSPAIRRSGPAAISTESMPQRSWAKPASRSEALQRSSISSAPGKSTCRCPGALLLGDSP